MPHVGHTVVLTNDVVACSRFFQVGFSFRAKPSTGGSNASYCELVDDAQRILAFVTPQLLHETFPEITCGHAFGYPGGAFISIHVPNVPALYCQLLELGANAVAPPKKMPWGKTVALVRPPHCHVCLELTN